MAQKDARKRFLTAPLRDRFLRQRALELRFEDVVCFTPSAWRLVLRVTQHLRSLQDLADCLPEVRLQTCRKRLSHVCPEPVLANGRFSENITHTIAFSAYRLAPAPHPRHCTCRRAPHCGRRSLQAPRYRKPTVGVSSRCRLHCCSAKKTSSW